MCNCYICIIYIEEKKEAKISIPTKLNNQHILEINNHPIKFKNVPTLYEISICKKKFVEFLNFFNLNYNYCIDDEFRCIRAVIPIIKMNFFIFHELPHMKYYNKNHFLFIEESPEEYGFVSKEIQRIEKYPLFMPIDKIINYDKYYFKQEKILLNINCDSYPAWKPPRKKTSLNISVNSMDVELWELSI